MFSFNLAQIVQVLSLVPRGNLRALGMVTLKEAVKSVLRGNAAGSSSTAGRQGLSVTTSQVSCHFFKHCFSQSLGFTSNLLKLD